MFAYEASSFKSLFRRNILRAATSNGLIAPFLAQIFEVVGNVTTKTVIAMFRIYEHADIYSTSSLDNST
jgi:hypothetical protein